VQPGLVGRVPERTQHFALVVGGVGQQGQRLVGVRGDDDLVDPVDLVAVVTDVHALRGARHRTDGSGQVHGARHVRWMFARRLSGVSVAGIARELNERGVPCPSTADRERNRHRSGVGWSVQSVQTILENPRYAGRQVWNRVANDRDEVDLRTGRSGQVPNLPQDWAISQEVVHTPLVSMRDFTAVQNVRARRPNGDGGERRYLLSGLVVCGVCGRRMDAHWVHGRPGYRCRHGYSSARPRPVDGARSLYPREEHVVEEVDALVVSPEGRRVVGGGLPGYLRDAGLVVVCGFVGVDVRSGMS
jgi:hypothetical protein